MADKNNTIPEMLGGRVRKRRMSVGADLPSKKAKAVVGSVPSLSSQKTVVSHISEPIVNVAAKPAPAPVPKPSAEPIAESVAERASKDVVNPVAAKGRTKSSRQLRLTEILKRDRQQRLERSAPAPSIIKGAPHMDTRRPSYVAKQTISKRLADAEISLCTPERPSRDASSGASRSSASLPPKYAQSVRCGDVKTKVRVTKSRQLESVDSVVTPSSNLASTRIRTSGSEAITYSRTMLPSSHLILLDILAGIETAANLLRTRQEVMSFAAVKTIVAKNSKRDFSFRHLSQLAHLVPEILCVLPSRNPRRTGREDLILRLDNVDQSLKSADGSDGSSFASAVGASATRSRRRLLHDRLLEHVREHHSAFLKLKGITSHESNMWNQDFDLEADVPQLGAPPLYPISTPKSAVAPVEVVSLKKSEPQAESPVVIVEGATVPKSADVEKQKTYSGDDDESCIPLSLLERVRARSASRNASVLAKNQDYRTNPDYLTRLPATMDAVASILRNDRRQAFGWSQLIARLVKLHPRKWPGEELERQLTSITEIADEWCSKVTLSGPKARFAFRVKNEKKFSSQRAKVVSRAS